jgi:hypothetical protein
MQKILMMKGQCKQHKTGIICKGKKENSRRAVILHMLRYLREILGKKASHRVGIILVWIKHI